MAARGERSTQPFRGWHRKIVPGRFEDYATLFAAASKSTGVPVNTLKSVASTESRFDPLALSSAGAMGMMQLMRPTAADYGLVRDEDIADPGKNILAGAKYLAKLIQHYHGDNVKAIAAYNWGEGHLDRALAKHGDSILHGGRGLPAETQSYVPTVMAGMGSSVPATTSHHPTPIKESSTPTANLNASGSTQAAPTVSVDQEGVIAVLNEILLVLKQSPATPTTQRSQGLPQGTYGSQLTSFSR
jgi:hypothetical protein